MDKKLIEFKQKAKKKKPKFIRQESHKRRRLPKNWRKPKGMHSKLRLRRRGKPKMVSVGYKMPEEVRGTTKQGLRQIAVSKPEHLKYIKAEEVVVVRKVSNRTRLEILKEAQKLKIHISNFRNIAKRIEQITAKLSQKKESREHKEKRRAKKEEEEKKKAKMSQKAKELEEKKKKAEEKTEKKEEKKAEKEEAKPEQKEEKKEKETKPVESKEIEQKPEAKSINEKKKIKSKEIAKSPKLPKEEKENE